MSILQANGKEIDTRPIRFLVTAGEKNADSVTIQVDRYYSGGDLSGCTFTMRGINAAGEIAEQVLQKRIEAGVVVLLWRITDVFTAVPGTMQLELCCTSGDDIVMKYQMQPITIHCSPSGSGIPTPDASEQILSQMEQLLGRAQELTVKMPILKNGTWWIYNPELNEYEDSGQAAQGTDGKPGENGLDGTDGLPGADGKDGKSAYNIWLDNGNTGTEADFLESLKGVDGAPGVDGADGTDGQDGKSAYQIWLDAGNSGTEDDFLASLKGEKGDTGEQGLQGETGEQGLKGDVGEKGADGASAYEIAVENGFIGTEADWLESLHGADATVDTTLTKSGQAADAAAVGERIARLEDDSHTHTNKNVLDGITAVDSKLSQTSTNPVQNKAVAEAVSGCLKKTENAVSATELQTARTLKIGNTGKTFDGSADVEWTLPDIGASAIGHTHISITPYVTVGSGAYALEYRLAATISVKTWSHYFGVYAIGSRHAGTGILVVELGCENDTVSYENVNAQCLYYGADISGRISTDSYRIHVSEDGATAYFFVRNYDYSQVPFRLLHESGGMSISNGASMASIDTSVYGAKKCGTTIIGARYCEDTGWIDFIPSDIASTSIVRYRKIGNCVRLNGYAAVNASQSSSTLIGKLPEGYHPLYPSYSSIAHVTANSKYDCTTTVLTDGSVIIARDGALNTATQFAIDMSFLID